MGLGRRLFTLPNMHFQRVNRNCFYLKHQLGMGKAALGFGLDKIRTLVSLAKKLPYGLNGKNCCGHSSAFIFHLDPSSFLQVMRRYMESRISSVLDRIAHFTCLDLEWRKLPIN